MMPFDIEIPYTMKPGLRPLKENEPITYQDNLYNYYIEQKNKLCSPIFGNNATKELQNKVLAYLQCSDFTEATKKYQEDFVVWAPNTDGRLSIQIASVCFPSGWAPEEKINKTFAEIHEPVADNELIQKASDHIAKMITQKGPFVRSVWTVSNTANLSQHPAVKRPWTNETLGEMYYRTERQVTVPLDDCAIFFIRTYVVPLLTVDYEQIRKSIYSMSNSVLDYKNLHYVMEIFGNNPAKEPEYEIYGQH